MGEHGTLLRSKHLPYAFCLTLQEKQNPSTLMKRLHLLIQPQTLFYKKISREEFSSCAVITVTHRVPTLIDSEKVMVLSFGILADKVLCKKTLTFSLKEGVQDINHKSGQTKYGGPNVSRAKRCKVQATCDKQPVKYENVTKFTSCNGMKLREGLFPVDIRRPSSGVKLIGGVVSRDVDFISGSAIRRVANAVNLMDILPQLHDPQTSMAQSWVLQDHILRDSGICGMDDDYVSALACDAVVIGLQQEVLQLPRQSA
ncbi:hypothetical protein Tco_0236076 [Tanacetum coccineum]